MTKPIQRTPEIQPLPAALPPSSAGQSSRAVQLKAALRGHDYATQVQMLAPKGAADGDVRAAATRGISGSGHALPQNDKIQKSFGGYDISNVTAHTDAHAAEGAAAMGAQAYATGNHVVLGAGGDSLRTLAHEATHVVQQQAGVSLSGGVGQPGDAYERQADAVADAVEAGESAEGLLDEVAGAGGTRSAVQCRAADEDSNAGPLSPSQVAYAITKSLGPRRLPLTLETIMAAQRVLGIEETGVVDEATVQAVATRTAASGPAAAKTGPLEKTMLASLNVPCVEMEQGGHQSTPKSKSTPTPAEDAAMAAKGLGSYNTYLGTMSGATFLGHAVTGHSLFLDRLRHAEAFLQARLPEHQGSAALGQHLGITSTVGLRPTVDKDQMMHGIGFALDLNAPNNPWIAGDTAKKKVDGQTAAAAGGGAATTANDITVEVSKRACALMGLGTPVSADMLRGLSESMSTVQAFAVLEASNIALRSYRELASLDEAALRGFVKQALGGRPNAGAIGDETYWVNQIRIDHELLQPPEVKGNAQSKKTNWDSVESTNLGFMDLKEIVVQALRDAANLRWGATDQGSHSGDMMHFDAFEKIGTATSIRKAVRKERDPTG